MTVTESDILQDIRTRFPEAAFAVQPTADGIPTFWVAPGAHKRVLRHLKSEVEQPFSMLYDLTAIDERERTNRAGQPQPLQPFTVVYHLLSMERNQDLRIKVGLPADALQIETVTDLFPAAHWYECEAWDMFGIRFAGHPHLRRLLMPPWWQGHPLRKDHPARATEMGPFHMTTDDAGRMLEEMKFRPAEWGLAEHGEEFDYMFLNVGPHHPGTHGVLRIVLQMDGQDIVNVIPEIGFHHRGAEKMGERQSWHTYIPYTDRVDYLGGVMNNFPYVLAVEKLAGITAPDRARVIRILLAELYRIISHLVYYGTYAQDTGMMSPVFHMFTDRERALDIAEAVTGARMHPGWFRIGGVAQDLPAGWEQMVRDFLDYLPARLAEYDQVVLKNSIFRGRTRGVGVLARRDAVEGGATGPMLRASGLDWDLRKKRPYGGYEQFDFDVPTATGGDSFDRLAVHVEEMRQSLRILSQCVRNMPGGPYKSDHPLATPPRKEQTMQDIETLIHHFLGVSWGPVIPPGEASVAVEAAKGNNSYYLVSDGGTCSYRTRIRTPSFAHVQMLPHLCRGATVPDLVVVLGSIDFVLADVDR